MDITIDTKYDGIHVEVDEDLDVWIHDDDGNEKHVGNFGLTPIDMWTEIETYRNEVTFGDLSPPSNFIRWARIEKS